jgi:uncharacterized cupredoxin-like copper-binding protein
VGSPLLIGSINAFHICGGALAIWAVGVSIVGIRVKDFPRGRRQASVVAAISMSLVITTIATAIIEGAREADKEEAEVAEAVEPAAETTPAEPAPAETAAESAPAETAPAEAGGKLALAADPSGQLKFDKTSLESQAGPVTIDMKNDSPVPHDVSIEGGGVDERGKEVTDGGTSTVTADLKPGAYTFYCSVPGHREAGMEGKLTVR